MTDLLKQPTRILIAVPCLDYIHHMFAESLARVWNESLIQGLDVDLHFESGTLIHFAREHLARYALDNGYTHIFWMDADMTFPPDVIKTLLDTGKSFVSGIYRARREPYRYTLFEDVDGIWQKRDSIPSGLFEIDGCGFGCVFMETRLLADSFDLFGTCFMPVEGAGEDVCFCKRMKKMDEPMFADADIRCGHIKHTIIYP